MHVELASSDPRRVIPAASDWEGLCGNDICGRAWRMIDAHREIAISIDTVRSDEVPAYAEIYVDDSLRSEGEIGPKRDFVVPVGNSGAHRIEVRLANPITRNGDPRQIHVA